MSAEEATRERDFLRKKSSTPMSSTTSFDDSRPTESQLPSGDVGEGSNANYESRFQSQQFDSSFSNYDAHQQKNFPGGDSPQSNHEDLSSQETQSSPLIYTSEGPDGPILPPPSVMATEEGFALREWRRLNALRLEAKENEEKEMVRQIKEAAEQYKADFYKKLSITIENTKKTNREKEKLFLESQEKFHAEAGKHNWKAVAELIPREVPIIEKKGKKKVAITVIQGPKPGKPTDLSRMRQVLTRLKHNPPTHMKPKVPLAPPSSMEGKINGSPPLQAAPSVMATP